MNKENNNEGVNVAWAILGFFFPLIGLIIFIIWLANNNNNSKYIGLGALAGFIVRVVAIIALIIAILKLAVTTVSSGASDLIDKFECIEYGTGYKLVLDGNETYCFNSKTGDIKKPDYNFEDLEDYNESEDFD